MKKKLTALFLAVATCMTMSAPAFANESNVSDEYVPVLAEGETWHPADGIMVCEDDNCRKGHTPPKGYTTYRGYITGNSVADAEFRDDMIAITDLIPGLGTICSIIDYYLDYEEALINDSLDGHILADYYKYTYTNSNNYSWYHIVWYYRSEEDGLARYLTCEVYPDI